LTNKNLQTVFVNGFAGFLFANDLFELMPYTAIAIAYSRPPIFLRREQLGLMRLPLLTPGHGRRSRLIWLESQIMVRRISGLCRSNIVANLYL